MADRYDSQGNLLRPGEYERRTHKYGGYQFKYKDGLGRSQTICKHTLTALREAEEEVLREKWNAFKTHSSSSVNDFYIRWKSLKHGIKDSTFTNYKYMYERFIFDDFGKTKITEVKRSDVKALYINLTNDNKLQINTLETIHNVLHQVFDTAVDDDIIRYNPSDKALKELKREFKPVPKHALTPAEQYTFVEYLRKSAEYSRWYNIFTFLLHTGLRVGEATALQWSDITDLPHHHYVTVSKTLQYYHNHSSNITTMNEHISDTKTKAGTRRVPLDNIARECLSNQRQYANTHPCTCSVDGYNDFIFTNRFGETLHQDTLNKALRRIIRDCNADTQNMINANPKASRHYILLPQISCHTFRHTFCTNLCHAQIDVKTIQTIMGHSDIRTTMDIYAEATQHMTRRAIRENERKQQAYFDTHFDIDDTNPDEE